MSKNEEGKREKEIIEVKLAPPPEPKRRKKSPPESERKTELEEDGEE
nr:hypothetical protein [Candidatus Freyarchaeota archaeon]